MVEQPAVRTVKTLDKEAVAALAASVRGDIIGPYDAGYETARHVYNAMIDRRPALIVRCVDAADVIATVNFARAQDVPLAVRGGGHNVAGLAVCDDGVVADLSRMRGVWVDPARRTVHAEGGCTWGDVDHATHAFGLATPSGILSTTGVGGLTLGGGIGYLARKYGLSIDNLLSVDMVLADGRFVTASADENADLFWAVRGGGGNFGAVTSFEFRLHPVGMVVGGPIFYAVEQAGDLLRFYRDFIAQAPEELGAFFGFQIGPTAPFIPEALQGLTMCVIVACYTGPAEQADEALRPLREFGPPLLDLTGSLPFPALQSMFDALLPAGLQHYWKADFITDLSDEQIAQHVKFGPLVPVVQSTMHIYPISGAVQRVGKDETAFSYRDAKFVHVIVAAYPDPADTPKHVAWVRDYFAALHPYSAGGAYVNFLVGDEGDDRIKATYRENYDRLAAIKAKYDPTNLFRINQNIKPA